MSVSRKWLKRNNPNRVSREVVVNSTNDIMFVGTWTEKIKGLPAPYVPLPNVSVQVVSSDGETIYTARQRTAFMPTGDVPVGHSYHSCECEGSHWMFDKGLKGGGKWYQKWVDGADYESCRHIKQLIESGVFAIPERPRNDEYEVTWIWTGGKENCETAVGYTASVYRVPRQQCNNRIITTVAVLPGDTYIVNY